MGQYEKVLLSRSMDFHLTIHACCVHTLRVNAAVSLPNHLQMLPTSWAAFINHLQKLLHFANMKRIPICTRIIVNTYSCISELETHTKASGWGWNYRYVRLRVPIATPLARLYEKWLSRQTSF